jgi:hypothetical protein
VSDEPTAPLRTANTGEVIDHIGLRTGRSYGPKPRRPRLDLLGALAHRKRQIRELQTAQRAQGVVIEDLKARLERERARADADERLLEASEHVLRKAVQAARIAADDLAAVVREARAGAEDVVVHAGRRYKATAEILDDGGKIIGFACEETR